MSKTAATRPRAPRLPAAVRREQVLDAALSITAHDGVDAVSMESVAREVGIAKTVVYEAFPDRRALIAGLLDREHDRAMEELVSMFPASRDDLDPDALLLVALDNFLAALQANPERWRLLLIPSHGTPVAIRGHFERARARLLDVLVPIMEWGIAERGGPRLDPRLAAESALAVGETLARLYLADPQLNPPEMLKDFAARLLRVIGP
jgi:AcrR family transcriptional regulator